MNSLTPHQHKMYGKLCDEYNEGNWERLCSLQYFLKTKVSRAAGMKQQADLIAIANYAETDF